MGVTNYYTVGGELLGESTSGNRTDYQRDALGSVTGTVDSTGHAQKSYSYKPYGTPLSTSGAGSDPLFRWVGSQGYRSTGLAHSSHYVRMRHYAQEEGRWTTIDPLPSHILWLSSMVHQTNSNVRNNEDSASKKTTFSGAILIPLFEYSSSSPASFIDASGLLSVTGPGIGGPGPISDCLSFSIPFTAGIWGASVGITECTQCFVCCGDARSCDTLSANVCLSIGPSVLGIASLLDPEWWQVPYRVGLTMYSTLNNILGSLAGDAICMGFPTPGCPPYKDTYFAELCLSGCLLFVSASWCHPGTSSWQYGFCGAPSISICINIGREVCD